MPDLWECCSTKSLAHLIQFQYEHYGIVPAFFKRPAIQLDPASEEESLEETARFMAEPPSRRRDEADAD